MRKLFTLALLAGVALAGPAASPAFAAPHFVRMVGYHSRASYPAGDNEVRFFAVELRGDWAWEDLALAAEYGLARTDEGYCADTLRYQSRQIGEERFVVLGWKNMNTGENGWVALSLDEYNVCYFLANTGKNGTASQWAFAEWMTNDRKIKIRFTGDGEGGVEWQFLAPQ